MPGRISPLLFVSLLALGCRDAGDRSAPGRTTTAAPQPAAAPTWARDIAPIIHAKCSRCHHDGGPGPFALTEFAEVRDHAEQIVDVTARGYMPPWLPRPGAFKFEFEDQRRLTAAEKQLLADWLRTGLAAGELERAPAPPRFEHGWQLGEPDLIVEADAAFELAADGADIYRNFVIPVPPGPPRFVRAVELQPGPPTIVHHAVMRVDTTGEVRKLDAADPAPGFDGMVFGGARMPGGRFIGWTPGKSQNQGSDDRSWSLIAGTDLVVQVHLRPSGKPEQVRPKVGLHFARRPPTRTALAMELSSTDIDIAPGQTDFRATDSLTLPTDVLLLSIYPHAHYIGKQLEGFARLPDGRTLELIGIDDWDFNWQDEYRYVEPIALPKGTVISMDFRYDNSAANPRNPSSPPKRVRHGPNSTDEMAELIFEIEPANPADLQLLDAAFMAKWLDGQIEAGERALSERGDDPELLAKLAALLARAGRSDAAKQRYQAALALQDTPEIRVDLALLLAQLGDQAGSVQQLDAALALAPDHARAHLVRGDQQREAGRYVDALASYERAVAGDPKLVEAHNNRGVTFEKLDRPSEAAACFARAIELAPGRAMFHENLGRASEAAGQWSEALAAYEAALARNGGSLKAMRGAAWLLATHPDPSKRNSARAIELAETAGRMTEFRSPEIMQALAAALAAGGRFEHARQAIARAIELANAGGRADLLARYREDAALLEAGRAIVLD